MEELLIEAATLRPRAQRKIDAPLVTIDLPSLIKQVKSEKSWKRNDRNSITIFKTNGKRIVFFAWHKGAEMIEYAAKGLISVQILKGKILFTTDEESIELGKGQMLVLHEGVPHSLVAIKKTIFLLTITTTQRGE
jgi:quercetin dioxygenase-like cupin family protein